MLLAFASQASAGFTGPADGSKLQVPPTAYRGEVDPNPLTYDSSMLLRLSRTGSSPGPVGTATDPVGIDEFDIPGAGFGPPLADGKYRVEAIRRAHRAAARRAKVRKCGSLNSKKARRACPRRI